MKTLVQNSYDSSIKSRVQLPEPVYRGKAPYGTGVTILALYRTPRSGRYFARTHSQWVKPDGTVQGESVVELDRELWSQYCRAADIKA